MGSSGSRGYALDDQRTERRRFATGCHRRLIMWAEIPGFGCLKVREFDNYRCVGQRTSINQLSHFK